MKAAIYDGVGQVRLREVERTPPPPGHVIVQVRQSGICGSDLHAYLGHFEPRRVFAPGHEYCGEIVELGEGVTGFALGDVVTAEVFWHCGDCRYCHAGLYNHCLARTWNPDHLHGGFAEYATVPAATLFRLPPGMSYEQGALVEPLAVAVRALALAQPAYADRVVVIGGGTIGLLCLAVAKAMGVREAWITVKYAQQAAVAAQLGADVIVQTPAEELRQVVAERTEGQGVEVVVETVGSASGFDDALAIVRPRGAVVLVAIYPEALKVNLQPIVSREVRLTGSLCYSLSDLRSDFQSAIDLIASGRVDPTHLVTHRLPLEEVSRAFALAADKQSGSVKVHVMP